MMNLPKIENINIGCDPHRIQQNEPCFFVNWQQNGENNYQFFALRYRCEDLKNKLTKKQKLSNIITELETSTMLIKQKTLYPEVSEGTYCTYNVSNSSHDKRSSNEMYLYIT